MNMKCRIESFNFSRLSDSPVPIATYTLYAIILVMSSIIHVSCDINKHVLNHMLPRSTVAGMSGRNQNWGRVPNRSQSFHNLLTGDETGQEPRLHLSQSISASHSALRISSAEEGLELLGTAAEDMFSNFEEADTSLLDYDSDNQSSEQAVVQKETSTAMDMDQAAMGTDPGERRQETAEMDATYFQCRAARLSGHKDQLISVSRDDSFGRTVIVPSAAIGSFENHSNIAVWKQARREVRQHWFIVCCSDRGGQIVTSHVLRIRKGWQNPKVCWVLVPRRTKNGSHCRARLGELTKMWHTQKMQEEQTGLNCANEQREN